MTSRAALARNIGAEAAEQALAAIRNAGAGHVLVDDVDPAAGTAAIVAVTRRHLAATPRLAGVVLLGGYDVVPSFRVDALPPRLRSVMEGSGDEDDFIVWNDDPYGDRDGDALPELPVSRVPDAHSKELFFTALAAPDADGPASRRGLRNIARPFADLVWATLPGDGVMLRSEPTLYNEQPPYAFDGERLYVMLHGSDVDGSRFWGERRGRLPVAMTTANVPRSAGMVAFLGCCWGAMTVDTKACDAQPEQPPKARAAETSIALTFLARGARAVVGCTGSHYSPVERPYRYFGQPMHEVFWRSYNGGSPPAKALFEAKTAYMRDIPHGQPAGGLDEAIEFKILRAYTCLGLGW